MESRTDRCLAGNRLRLCSATEIRGCNLSLPEGGDTDAAHAAFKASSDALFELSQRGRLDEQGRTWLEEADSRLQQPF
jgi:hypothetical protein